MFILFLLIPIFLKRKFNQNKYFQMYHTKLYHWVKKAVILEFYA